MFIYSIYGNVHNIFSTVLTHLAQACFKALHDKYHNCFNSSAEDQRIRECKFMLGFMRDITGALIIICAVRSGS